MLEVIKAEKKEVKARVVHGGMVSDHKGINLPGTPVSIPALTEKDLSDLQFGLGQGVDYVAMSFVRSADDIRQIKRYAPTTPIIAKLEKPQAVDRIDEISQIADGVMIARGDLGVEMPLERVPLIQKTGIERTNYHGKIAIVATQMLESMIVSPQPTRAEVSDVANAILDGADSVMLSAETATGANPVEAVRTMAAIIEEVERSARYQALPEAILDRGESTFATAVAKACAAAAGQLGIGTVCVYTRTGETARQIGEYRPTARILAFTASQQAYQRMALYWGVTARRVPKPFESTDEMIANIAQTLVGSGDAMRGEAVVIASAVPPNRPTFGASMMQIHRLGSRLAGLDRSAGDSTLFDPAPSAPPQGGSSLLHRPHSSSELTSVKECGSVRSGAFGASTRGELAPPSTPQQITVISNGAISGGRRPDCGSSGRSIWG